MHCPGCGRPSEDCPGCLPAFDPPRYCADCGGWLAVRVSTGGWVARCKIHGETTAAR
ncbi:MAG: hypothetical protein JWN29_2828 [Acidimicrobiales bacterium]|jgi:hypothetical protein|nr:hypothetical protein [Acidimicrobiales bacterium]